MTTPDERIGQLWAHLVWLAERPTTPGLAQYQAGRLDGVKQSYALVTGITHEAIENRLAVVRRRHH